MRVSSDLAQIPTAQRPRGRVEKAAQDFESILLSSLFESLQKTFSGFGEEGGALGSGDYSYMGTKALASGMAASGGIGIARLILQHLPHTKVSVAG